MLSEENVGALRLFFPSLAHFHFSEYDSFYEPAEDTFLFCDAISADLAHIRTTLTPPTPPPTPAAAAGLCVEIGTGSGTVITHLAHHVGAVVERDVEFLAADINPRAVEAARRTAEANGVGACVEVIRSDLLSAVEGRVRGCVDVLLFNPPYVPTPPEEVGSDGIEAAWAGGQDGREVIDRVLPRVDEWLSPTGVFYMVVVEENKPDEIARVMAEMGFETRTVMARGAKNERLSILRFDRIAAAGR